jgi:hypothetical protein
MFENVRNSPQVTKIKAERLFFWSESVRAHPLQSRPRRGHNWGHPHFD